jgi:hypothetical protein
VVVVVVVVVVVRAHAPTLQREGRGCDAPSDAEACGDGGGAREHFCEGVPTLT